MPTEVQKMGPKSLVRKQIVNDIIEAFLHKNVTGFGIG